LITEKLNRLIERQDEMDVVVNDLKVGCHQIKEWSKEVERFLENFRQAITLWSGIWDRLEGETSTE
jgi:hypothetical protein